MGTINYCHLNVGTINRVTLGLVICSKTVFELGENRFQKSFSVKPTCLAVTENDFRLTNIFTFDPEMISLLIFTSNHFRREREREREREKRREERAQIRERERAQITPRRRAVRSLIAPLVRRSYRANERRDRRSRLMRLRCAIVDRAA